MGGGWSKEERLRIMKDSRIGTYGALGLVFLLLLKFFALLQIETSILPWVWFAGNTLSRFVSISELRFIAYVQDAAKSKSEPIKFNYGPLGCLPEFKDSHPSVMKEWIEMFDWSQDLDYGKSYNLNRPLMKHEKLKYRLLRKVEKFFFQGKHLFAFNNWTIINP